ncbi:MAG: succinate dehydrogenase/fumarate reductase flavoprotein subunit, partial [SAR202 cluster bacterium]|nr:succinate dehydrogenase/fumarate reductase flavoprotein subunit [SAR202 cluster bacterium]
LHTLDELSERHKQSSAPPIREYNLAWQEWLNVGSILTVAKLTCLSALARKESRGSHYRSDYPERDDRATLSNILAQSAEDEAPHVWNERVRFTRMSGDTAGTRSS